ncbi:PH domain-containing protein [Micromonospora auratinigra]|uniref:Putative membrane protein n=1 Tax=Micromonospora auratinigra TaxID=261654 RepID=A0A1A8ZFW5_9ACTN|nr:PH domain-containing protein [Micromonospora auratinigra]SBT42767.1 putative membrane protein [Micromonospora auratinigra]
MTSPVTEAPPVAVEWRRLSPRMLLVHPVQELLRIAPVLLGVMLAGSRTGRGELWGLLGAGIAVLFGLLRWATTSYRVDGEQVQVRSGLLRRSVLSVPLGRVRAVDISANPLQRVLGLARLTIGTGHTGRRDDRGLQLNALERDAATRLRDELLHRRAAPPADPAAEETAPVEVAPAAPAPTGERTLAAVRPGWARYGPFTLSGLGAVGVVTGVFWQFVAQGRLAERNGPVRAVLDHLDALPVGLAVAQVVLVAAVLLAVASTVGYALAFGNFRLSRHPGGTLHVTRGLLAHRATTIEQRRLRGVEISEPLLLRAVRGARCLAVATGLRAGRGAERGGTLLLPPAPRDAAYRVAEQVLGDPTPMRAELVAHGPAARRRRFTRAVVPVVVVVLGLLAGQAVGVPQRAGTLAMLALPVAALLGADRYRSLGHRLVDGFLVTRQGSLVRRRTALDCDGVVGWVLRQSWFQRRSGLVTLTAATAAGEQAYHVLDVDESVATELVDRAVPGLLAPFLDRS